MKSTATKHMNCMHLNGRKSGPTDFIHYKETSIALELYYIEIHLRHCTCILDTL